MKAIIFYLTAVLSTVLVCAEISFPWFILMIVNVILITWCYKNISFKEFIRYSGYSLWYKLLKS